MKRPPPSVRSLRKRSFYQNAPYQPRIHIFESVGLHLSDFTMRVSPLMRMLTSRGSLERM